MSRQLAVRPSQSFLVFAFALVGGLLVAPAVRANAPFGPEQTIISGLDLANNVSVGDLDGANGLDVFAAAEAGSDHRVALQTAGGSWTTQTLTPGVRTRGTAVTDLDGDGHADLLYGDFSGNHVYWRKNDLAGSGVFLAPQSLATIYGAQGLVAADVDGDTDLDVVVAGRVADGYFWLENVNGDASVWTTHTITTGVNAAQVVVAADLDGDGDLDVAGGSASGSGKLTWYENLNGDGTSWLGRTITLSRFRGIAAGDLDLDGDVDLLAQDANSNTVDWWENTAGDGTLWSRHTVANPGGSVKGLVAVDLDFDGDLDVVGGTNGDWFENTAGDGSSWTARSFIPAGDLSATDVADMDGDGDKDIVAARYDADKVSWWANLTCSPGDPDADSDGVRDGCDVCSGFDDTVDTDGDTVPDGCDVCPGGDDRVDTDGNSVPDACEGGASISIASLTAAEGDSGTTSFSFDVTLTGSVAGGFTVSYATQDESATTADSDYVDTSGTINFTGTDGETQTITVPVGGDVKVEADETFLVQLGTPSNPAVTVADGSGRGTIANDDSADLSIDDPSVVEGDSGTTSLVFLVTLTGEVDGGFTIDYFTEDDSATVADGDYTAVAGTLTFDGTDGEQHMIVVPVAGDTKVEPDERVSCLIRNPSVPAITVSFKAHGTIQNDDSATVAIGDVTKAEGDVGTTSFVFPVTLSGDVAGGFTVPFNTANGSATTGDSDYVFTSGTLTFTGTDTETQTITVTVNGDTVVEGDETFTVVLGMPSKSGVTATGSSGSSAVGTIQNDDSATVTIGDVTQAEGDAGTTSFVFDVTLSGDVAGGFTVPFNTANGSATTTDGDYVSTSGTLTFAGTDTETQTITVTVNGDTVVEGDETFTVTLGMPSKSGVTATGSSGSSAVGTIQNDDSATVAIGDVTQAEGDAGTTSFVFDVTLSGDVAGGFTVPFNTANGSATTGDSDYVFTSGTLTFAGTDTETQTITVTVNGDTVVEGDETFTVVLGMPSKSGVTASDGSGLGTIQNDDSATISVGDVSLAEGDTGTTSFAFDVTLSGDVAGGFTVSYSTADGSATTGDADYAAASGTLTFTGTDTETQTITVAVTGDTVVEGDETFTVALGTPSNGDVTASDDSGLGTIENDDSATVTVGSVSQAEGDAGTTDFTFDVTLTGDVAGGFTVSYNSADGSATIGDSDYVATSGTLTFTGTDTETQTITVTVNGDTVVEGNETFTVDLGDPSNGDVTSIDGTGTIENDDSATVTIDNVSQAEGDTGTTDFVFTVTLSGDVAGGFMVPFTTADGTATIGDSDYVFTSGTLTFTGTDTETQTITVTVNGDTVVEGDETFTLALGMPSVAGVTANGGSGGGGLGTILNDDSATIAIGDVSQAEGDAGTTGFVFTVTLSGDVAGGFTVPFSTTDGSATAGGSDYVFTSGTLTFTGTNTETQTVTVAVNGDTVVEADETFTVDLGSTSNASVTVSDGSGLGTIQNDDDGPLLAATKQVSAFEAPYGSVEYLIQISNLGSGGQLDDPASDEFTDVLPPELELVSASSDTAGFGVAIDTGSNTAHGNGVVAPGTTVTLTIEATVLAGPGAEISNQGVVRFDTDHDGVNDSSDVTDDPTSPGIGDPTVLRVPFLVEIPTLGMTGLAALALLLAWGAIRRL